MYGDTLQEATECDVIADGLFDFRESFILFSEHKLRQEDPASFDGKVRDQRIPRYMGTMEAQLQRNRSGGGNYLVGTKRSYADIALLEVLELVEEMYPGLLAREYPLVTTFHLNIKEEGGRVANYLESERRHPPLNQEYITNVREVLPVKN